MPILRVGHRTGLRRWEKACAYGTNFYSGRVKPTRSFMRRSSAPSLGRSLAEGRCVARHERSYRLQQQILDLEHYLDVLERNPGALAGGKPFSIGGSKDAGLPVTIGSGKNSWSGIGARPETRVMELFRLGRQRGYIC